MGIFSWLPAWLGGGETSSAKNQKPVVFHFETIETKHLGVIRRPVAKVEFWSPEFNEWQTHTMLIDTGADYTILPMYMAGLLGLDMSKADTIKTNGIEGARQTSFLEGVKVRLGKHERSIPVGIAHTSRIPPLMGRHLFFETFHTIFEGSDRVVFSDLEE
jgi:predicted aspartyl protease